MADHTPGGWQPIETAPKGEKYGGPLVLLHGRLSVAGRRRDLYPEVLPTITAVGCWDDVDEAWCLTGGAWDGPWINATHWMPLPAAPSAKATAQ